MQAPGGGLLGTGAERKRGKETGLSPRLSPRPLTPPFQSSGQKKKVSFADLFFSVCGCHLALEFGPPKSKSNLESWELKELNQEIHHCIGSLSFHFPPQQACCYLLFRILM